MAPTHGLKMEYRFSRLASECRRCHAPLTEGEAYVSALCLPVEADYETAQSEGLDDPEIVRHDYHTGCWSELARPHLEAGSATIPAGDRAYFSWWRARKAEKPQRPPTADPDFLHQLFAQTHRLADPERPTAADAGGEAPPAEEIEEAVRLAYLAALGLMRLKQFTLRRHFRREQGQFLAFTPSGSRREIIVRDPGLSEEEFTQVEARLTEIADRLREGN